MFRCVLRKEPAWSTSDTVRVVGSAPVTEDMEVSLTAKVAINLLIESAEKE